MADAVVGGKKDALLKYLADDFNFRGQTRAEAAEQVTQDAKRYKVNEIEIRRFDVEFTEQSAKVYIRALVHHGGGDAPVPVGCRGVFVKDKGQWKLKTAIYSTPW
jgi:hypothetical protein